IGPARNVVISSVGLGEHNSSVQDRMQYVDYSTRDLQESITPDQVLDILKAGNERFFAGRTLVRDLGRQMRATADTQHPLAVVLSGTSSRTPVESIFDVGVGDISCTRTTANVVREAVLASLEYATEIDGAKLILVMGHTNNEAMRLAVEAHVNPESRPSHLPSIAEVLQEVQMSVDEQ